MNWLIYLISLVQAIVFGRLIAPGSESSTYNWFKKRTALSELQAYDITNTCKDSFYEIGNKIYENKEFLESSLYKNERIIFLHTKEILFLYDFTNKYMEGS